MNYVKYGKRKKEIVNNFQNEITIVKNNFENLKNFYEQQKLIFQAEQNVNNGSSFILLIAFTALKKFVNLC